MENFFTKLTSWLIQNSQTLSNWASISTIISVFIALVFGYWAITLTKKYGENVDQLNVLKDLVKTSQSQTGQLIDIVNAVKDQNQKIDQQLSVQISEWGAVLEQLAIFKEQKIKVEESEKLNNKRNQDVFLITVKEIQQQQVKGFSLLFAEEREGQKPQTITDSTRTFVGHVPFYKEKLST